MSNLNNWLDFTTVEEGEHKLKQAEETRDRMHASIFWQILDEDCEAIEKKILKLKLAKQ